MHDSRSALPARSPIPFTQVLTHASCPASRSPSAPDTELATAMPRSLWQWVSTGRPTAVASSANRSRICPGESPPIVSQYAPATRPPPVPRARTPAGTRRRSATRPPRRPRCSLCRRPGDRHGGGHLVDDRGAVELAAELARDHLVRGGDRHVVVAQALAAGHRDHGLDVGRHCRAPAGQPQVPERRLGQRQACSYVRTSWNRNGDPTPHCATPRRPAEFTMTSPNFDSPGARSAP